MVRPLLEYNSVIWSPHLRKHIEKLERVQHRATKCLPSIRNLTYEDRLRKLKLPTLSYRRRRKDVIEVFKSVNNINKISTNTHCTICPDKHMFEASLSTHTRGHNRKFQVTNTQRSRTHFLDNRIKATWNQLTHKTVNSTSINQLKNNMKHDPALIGHLYVV